MNNIEIEKFLNEKIPNYQTSKQKIYNFLTDIKYINECPDLLLYLHNNKLINLSEDMSEIIINNEIPYFILDSVGNIFNTLNFDSISFIKFVKQIPKNNNYIYNESLNKSIKEYAENDIKRAKEIIKLLEIEIKNVSLNFFISLFQGIQVKNHEYVLNKFLIYLKNTEPELIKIGLILAKNFDYTEKFNFNDLTLILENINHEIDDIDYYIINLYCKIWEFEKSILKKIINVSKNNINKVSLILSDFINKNFSELKKQSKFHELLSLFYKVDNNNSGLNKVLSTLFTDEELWQDFLFNWIDNNNEYINKIGNSNFKDGRLPVFFHKIINNDRVFSIIVTQLFNSEKIIYQKYAIKLINFNIFNIRKKVILDLNIINSLNDIDCIFIIRKILGYLYDVEYLLPIIFSVLYKINLSEKLFNSILDLFLGFIIFNYPMKTKEYAENILNNKDEIINYPESVIKLSKIILTATEKYLNDIKSLPFLNELKVKRKNIYEVFKAENNKQKKIMNDVRKKSVIFDLFSQIYIKYGKGSFSFIHDRLTKKTEMKKFESSFNVPSNSILDPVGNELAILKFRSEKKKELNENNY
ncbi:MAG: hypothetical protein KAT05_18290 [Spirochaetes bacterium]|nr:hypothetical protein [Spirochaetota bacterium]